MPEHAVELQCVELGRRVGVGDQRRRLLDRQARRAVGLGGRERLAGERSERIAVRPISHGDIFTCTLAEQRGSLRLLILERRELMRYPKEEIEKYRKSAGDLENELIDEWNTGRSRGDLLRRGSVLGISLPFLGLLSGVPIATAAPVAPQGRRPGDRIGQIGVDGSLEPPLLQSLGALGVSMLAGEQLLYADRNAVLRPLLATSWAPTRSAGPGRSSSGVTSSSTTARLSARTTSSRRSRSCSPPDSRPSRPTRAS